jgi:hypothetical protein
VAVGTVVGEDGTVIGVVVAVGVSALSSFCVIGVFVETITAGVDGIVMISVGLLVGVFDGTSVDVDISYTAKINVGVGGDTPLLAALQAVKMITNPKQQIQLLSDNMHHLRFYVTFHW